MDLSDVTFIDSTGLGILVGFHKRLVRGGGRLIVRLGPNERVQRILDVTGLMRAFNIDAESYDGRP